MNMRHVLIAATVVLSAPLAAQTAAEHIVVGDRAHEAMDAAAALTHYEAAIQVDADNAEALWRASREAVDLGEFDDARRDSLYQLGEQYARRAVQANPSSSMAHFVLAKAIGRRALTMGSRDRVKFAGVVRQEALEALRLDSLNAGALHIMGRWHANVMRLSGVSRFIAKNLLGGRIFSEANWRDAAAYLERAAALEPDRVVHKLELASVYADSDNKAKARETYQAALQLKPVEYNDKRYLEQAQRRLDELK
jgi:tetratricopeptide (TPR) repeat protein